MPEETTGGVQPQNADGASTAPEGQTAGTAQTEPQSSEKTFTQTEVNSLIQSRLERERKSQPSKDELAAFRKWQEEQKTAEEKHADEIRSAQEARDEAERRAGDFEAKYKAVSKGVKPEAVDDVIALARARVSDDVTIEQAIDDIVKSYPVFTAARQEVPVTTGISTSNNTASSATDEAAARSAMGLPPRK